MRHAHDMAIFSENNAVLRAFGISVLQESNQIVIGVRTAPQIRFANNQICTPDSDSVNYFLNYYFLIFRRIGANKPQMRNILILVKLPIGLFFVITKTKLL